MENVIKRVTGADKVFCVCTPSASKLHTEFQHFCTGTTTKTILRTKRLLSEDDTYETPCSFVLACHQGFVCGSNDLAWIHLPWYLSKTNYTASEEASTECCQFDVIWSAWNIRQWIRREKWLRETTEALGVWSRCCAKKIPAQRKLISFYLSGLSLRRYHKS